MVMLCLGDGSRTRRGRWEKKKNISIFILFFFKCICGIGLKKVEDDLFLLCYYEMKKAYPLLISLFFSIQKKLVKTFSGIK